MEKMSDVGENEREGGNEGGMRERERRMREVERRIGGMERGREGE